MTAEANQAGADETGGMLLGYATNERDTPEAVVETVIGPGPGAHHERTRFEPDGPWQQEELGRIYLESASATYLGDWHSHPGGGAAPSTLDRKTASAIARRRRARMPHPLMLILHGRRQFWDVALYCYSDGQLKPVPATLFD